MITGRSIASSVIQHLKNPPNGHQTTTILVLPQWTFGGICCGSAEASTLCPACPGLCVALASLAPLKNFSHTKVSLGVFGFFREPPVNLFFFIGCTAVNIIALKSRPLYVFHKASLSVSADTPTHNLFCCYCAIYVYFLNVERNNTSCLFCESSSSIVCKKHNGPSPPKQKKHDG